MIRNATEVGGSPGRDVALACIEAGIEAAHPRRVVTDTVAIDDDALRIGDRTYDLREFDRILVVGGGKAAGTVAAELEQLLGDRIAEGVVVVADPVDTARVKVVVGDHPVPSDDSRRGAERVLEVAREADEATLVLAVITGGGSALLSAPEGVSLQDLQSVTNALLESGASIDEINAVRKHLSQIKGGGLARAAMPATVVGLVFSDVVGNDLSVIASGPTAPDETTFHDAIMVLDRYGIEPPPAVRERLERGQRGEIPETPRPDDPVFNRVTHHVLADGFTALSAARAAAERNGYSPLILSSRIRGEAREAAHTHVGIADEIAATGNPLPAPAVVLTGGETTVTVRGGGRGGPNQEFVLSAAIGLTDAVIASVDTDGRDGGTDAAGAIADGTTVDDPSTARAALDDNDAYSYLETHGALIETGSTGTNVNDLRILVVD